LHGLLDGLFTAKTGGLFTPGYLPIEEMVRRREMIPDVLYRSYYGHHGRHLWTLLLMFSRSKMVVT